MKNQSDESKFFDLGERNGIVLERIHNRVDINRVVGQLLDIIFLSTFTSRD